ncbi:hypothetical protein [Sorangium atrum]|uniref:Uncharacterized protein n=1 Tax=Sorangium atrum TaxID=2995308 RepID=A0ABT5BY92_9BACT|nr:hypothetical protein [Sorangium aterium]MDC0679130.1 hypothetical protein [Sorangium aterium]
MYLSNVSYDTVVAFVEGYDLALHGGFLVGFREWLIVKLDDGNNLSWPVLVLGLMERVGERSPVEVKSAEGQSVAMAFLFDTLEKFVHEREAPSGLRRIYRNYENWLTRQDWYSPLSPDWIPDTEEP